MNPREEKKNCLDLKIVCGLVQMIYFHDLLLGLCYFDGLGKGQA